MELAGPRTGRAWACHSLQLNLGDRGNEMRPSIEGLVCTIKPFQVILKHFRGSQLFVDPGASFDGFDAHSSMGAKETCS